MSKNGNSQEPLGGLRPPLLVRGEQELVHRVDVPSLPQLPRVCVPVFFLFPRKLLFSRQLQLKRGPLTSSNYTADISKGWSSCSVDVFSWRIPDEEHLFGIISEQHMSSSKAQTRRDGPPGSSRGRGDLGRVGQARPVNLCLPLAGTPRPGWKSRMYHHGC